MQILRRTRVLVALAAGVLIGCSSGPEGLVQTHFENSLIVSEQGWAYKDLRGDDARYTVGLVADDVLPRAPATETLLRACPDAELDDLWERAELEALALELWDGGEQPRGRVDCPKDFSRAKLDQQMASRDQAQERRRRAENAVTPEQKKILRLSYRDFNLEGSASFQGRWIRLQAAAGRWYEDSRVLQVTFWPFRLSRNDVAAVSRERTLAGLNKALPEGGFETMPYVVVAIRFGDGQLTAANVAGVTVDLYGWTAEDELLSFDLNPSQVFQQLEMREPKLGGAVHLRVRANDQAQGLNVQAVGVAPLLVSD